MKIHIKLLILLMTLSSLCISSLIQAQSFSGLVIDESAAPVGLVSVSLLSIPDSTIVSTSTTDNNGHFLITNNSNLSHESLRFLFEKSGYDRLFTPATNNDTIILRHCYADIQELSVVAKRNGLKMKDGRILFDPATLDGVTNATQILQKMPLVSAFDNVVSIFGRGKAKIYINGKKPQMPEETIMDYLNSIPANYVKTIQIVPDAGAAFGSNDKASIVNIIIDDPRVGFNGNINAGLKYSNGYFSPNASAFLNYATRKLSINIRPSFSNGYNKTHGERNYLYHDNGDKIEQLYSSYSKYTQIGGVANFEYQFNPLNSINAYYQIHYNYTHQENINEMRHFTTRSDDFIETSDKIVAESSPLFKNPAHSAGINSTHFIGNGILNLSADFTDRHSLISRFYEFDETSAWDNTLNHSQGIDGKAQFVWTFNDNSRLNTGYEYYHSLYRDDITIGGYTSLLPDPTNVSVWENTNSIFASYNKQISAHFNFNVGLRSEYYMRDISFDSTDDSYRKLYLYPSATLAYTIDKYRQTFRLSYNTYSDLVRYQLLNPNIRWISSIIYTKGDPQMDKGYLHSINLDYSLKNTYFVSLSYTHSSNVPQEMLIQHGKFIENTYITTGYENSVWLSLDYSKTLTDFLTVKGESLVTYSDINANLDDSALSKQNWSWLLYGAMYFNISKRYNWSIALVGSLHAPSASLAAEIGWRYSLSSSISKTFGRWGQLNINLNDFCANRPMTSFKSESLSYQTRRLSHPFSAGISFSVYFGNQQAKKAYSRMSQTIESRYVN